jgi:hypothetical protein
MNDIHSDSPLEELKQPVISEDVVKPVNQNTREVTQKISHAFGLSVQSGPPPEFYEKINSEHIDKILDISDKDNERASKYLTWALIQHFGIILCTLIFFGFLAYILKSTEFKEIFEKIIIAGFGFLGGYGVGSHKKSS